MWVYLFTFEVVKLDVEGTVRSLEHTCMYKHLTCSQVGRLQDCVRWQHKTLGQATQGRTLHLPHVFNLNLN